MSKTAKPIIFIAVSVVILVAFSIFMVIRPIDKFQAKVISCGYLDENYGAGELKRKYSYFNNEDEAYYNAKKISRVIYVGSPPNVLCASGEHKVDIKLFLF